MNERVRFGAGFSTSLVAVLLLWSCAPGWHPVRPEMTFDLVGLHEPLPCESCHPASLPLGPLPAECAACHEDDRPADHADGDCGICHTPFGWGDVVVNHDFFPLTNAHELDCTSCHAPDTYEGLDPSCSSCHEEDRKDPGHYPGQDCGDCHNPTTWGDVDFDHDELFPLPHQGVDTCNSCHLGGDTSSFSCVDCHEHSDRAEVADDHEDVGNFEYNSQACLDCHPNGRE